MYVVQFQSDIRCQRKGRIGNNLERYWEGILGTITDWGKGLDSGNRDIFEVVRAYILKLDGFKIN